MPIPYTRQPPERANPNQRPFGPLTLDPLDPRARGLSALWMFNSPRVTDVGGACPAGSIGAGAFPTVGPWGPAVRVPFAGVISIPSCSALDFDGPAITVLVGYIKIGTGNNHTIIDKAVAGTHTAPYGAYNIFIDSGTNFNGFLTTSGGSNVNLSTGIQPSVGPHVFGLSCDGTTVRGYLDGTMLTSASWPGGTIYRSTFPLLLGTQASGGENADGTFVWAGIWKRALSAGEISSFNFGQGGQH